ncbi:hypothetical protein [Pleurocapsa sp. FMAR1]|uniref:hypothetical protein n=1 Tax=Pleurocapsa sp. FMAR1 TaxID=3040204 RepID=UPI0029C70299|nr:hypothetical protein [Pleurocapsa sp. FMAR1]
MNLSYAIFKKIIVSKLLVILTALLNDYSRGFEYPFLNDAIATPNHLSSHSEQVNYFQQTYVCIEGKRQ